MHWIALRVPPDAALPADLPDALAALGWWALQFTPKVALLDDALLLELSASERLWGGRKPLLHQIFESNKPVASVNYARGATSLIANARLKEARLARTRPDDLPLAALAAARPHLATLARIGCTHWGQLRALPRGGVARRFGAPLLDALDRAYGQKPDLYPWLVLPDVFEATLELGSQVETAPALLFGARRLLNQLQLWLQLRQAGALALVLRWTMDPRRNTATEGELVLRSAEPTGNMAHLLRLLGEQLAHVSLPAPVQYLHLRTLETQKLGGETSSLLPDDQRPGDSLQCLLERLSARLGPQQVLQMQAHADHRPERMQSWNPASNATPLIAACANNTGATGLNDLKNLKTDGLYPSWLLASPLKLEVHHNRPQYPGPLILLAGPQRLEAGWWDGGDCALRDYFLARSERMGLLWIYRQRLSRPGRDGAGSDWYLHGLFA
jgi:protein ImuB